MQRNRCEAVSEQQDLYVYFTFVLYGTYACLTPPPTTRYDFKQLAVIHVVQIDSSSQLIEADKTSRSSQPRSTYF